MKRNKPSLSRAEKELVKAVLGHYKACGRHDLPWRKTVSPYHIVVSELMLQQTQVPRVIPKYQQFLKTFPTVRRLAQAPLGDVLKEWQGLGYNRRAKFLWQAAQAVVQHHSGAWPITFEGLQTLPGIGTYTAGAVMNFAYNTPVPLIETNIRTVFIYHLFKDGEKISDKELFPIIERTLDVHNPREWNWALMDYGAYLKGTVGNLNKQSKTYKKQSNFKESNRYVRGAIIRALSAGAATEKQLLLRASDIDNDRVIGQLAALKEEGLVAKVKGKYQLP
jgi:A/G-specific adenine glycosylase